MPSVMPWKAYRLHSRQKSRKHLPVILSFLNQWRRHSQGRQNNQPWIENELKALNKPCQKEPRKSYQSC